MIYKESIIVALIILYASLIRTPHIRLPQMAFIDKWSHMLAYALLGAVLAWNLIKDKRKCLWVWILGLALPIVYGGLIEILQGAFFAPRTADWWDWLADIIGTVIGTGLVAGIWQARS